MFKTPDKFRMKTNFPWDAYEIPMTLGKNQVIARCIASDGGGWEHVSVTLNRNRCATWDEMVKVKSLFWDESDTVIQFHPMKTQYVNIHQHCLHLWRRSGENIELPPTYMV